MNQNNQNNKRRNQDNHETEEINELIVFGRNAVIEGMKSGRSVDKLLMIESGHQEGSAQKILGLAKDMNILVQYVAREKLDQLSNQGKHQGVLAFMAAHDYVELEVLFEKAKKRDEAPFFIILDGIEDPHNLGAIIRTANITGAHGIIIPKNRAVSLTATVAKTSAGAIEYTPVCKVVNLVRTIEDLKSKGIWVAGSDMKGTSMYDVDFKGPMALVIGSEGKGLSRLVKEKCDFIASIPMKGNVDSLNASVAAGVLMYEALRQRNL
ncbi:MAG: 23S rRNA (guanosine(2251)-2'-O)-methyltransferase RlmB [Vallitaleaceae bacterium]|nr:23S rRNA (guanosine(2251)-2'-O)-methyltransferase RlmB [Vallitaleaceae bacterium]